MLKLVAPRDHDWFDVTPILLIFTLRLRQAKWRRCTRCSMINEMDDAESSNALTWFVEPLGTTILTQQVISKTWQWFCSWGACVKTTVASWLDSFFALHAVTLWWCDVHQWMMWLSTFLTSLPDGIVFKKMVWSFTIYAQSILLTMTILQSWDKVQKSLHL